jgi:hypothetical protein
MNPKPFLSLNHFTVPVAILFPLRDVFCETRRVLDAAAAKTLGTGFFEPTLETVVLLEGGQRRCAESG